MERSYLFEVSWEVCNKVGGIYTVLKSKAVHMKAFFKENYFLVGPFLTHTRQVEFDELPPPQVFKEVFAKLRNEGIICHFGRWLIPSSPSVILVDYNGYTVHTNEIKGWLYQKYGIDSLGTAYHDYDEPIVWGSAVARMLELLKQTSPQKNMIVHCHEWLAAGTGLTLKGRGLDVKLVFTTHATVLGRALAAVDPDFYNRLETINPEQEARGLGVHTKHQTEKALANNVNVFTTVSEVTGIEAAQFFGRKPDFILPNGLDMSVFPNFEKIAIRHKALKRKIKEFLEYALFPYYNFNVEDTLIMFTAARYEFHGKGLDVFIQALGKLDRALTKNFKGKSVAVFFWIPKDNVRGIHPELLENKTYFHDIKESILTELPDIEEKLVYRVLANKKIIKSDLLSDGLLRELKQKLKRFKKHGEPRLCTHVVDEGNDLILKGFRENGLLNREGNAVKVFLYPIYLNGADGLLDMDYYECIMASHVGVFPSFYEPWGYTPVEAAALGTLTLTTDLSGFGRYFLTHYKERANNGIYVLPRQNLSDEAFAESLSRTLYRFVTFSHSERIENKMEAKRLSSEFDWQKLVGYYFLAYEAALRG